MVRGFIFGRMVESIRGIILMIGSMGRGGTIGLTVRYLRASGSMGRERGGVGL